MTIVYVGICWFAGIWLAARLVGVPNVLWMSGSGLCLLLAWVARREGKRTLALWLLCGAALAAGGLRYRLAQQPIDADHIASHNGDGPVMMTAEVVDEPAVYEGYQELRVAAATVRAEDDLVATPTEGLVLVRVARYPLVPYGAQIEATGELQNLTEQGDRGYQAHLARQQIYSVMPWPALEKVGQGGDPVRRVILALKDEARDTINQILPEPQAALLVGILLGDDSGLSKEMQDDFRATGMTHIIAISGFNIAILVGIVVWLGQPLVGRRAVLWLTLLVVALYSVLVGAESSVVRAAFMGILLMFSLRFLGRRTFALAPLVTAGLLMTLIDPNALWDIGFQLSFAATLGILLYVPPVTEWTRRQLAPRLGRETARQATRFVSDLLIVTLAAQVLVLPLLVYHFESLSPISPLANLLILPAQPAVMTFGGLATLAGMVYVPVGQAIGWVAWIFLAHTTGMVSLLADIPWASVPVSVSTAVLLSYYVLVFSVTWLVYQRQERRAVVIGYLRENIGAGTVLAAGVVVAILALSWAFSLPDGNLHVAFLDVGQGDATLIQTPGGRQMLVDGGPEPALLAEQVSEELPFWDRDLDLVVATHPDNDHVAGLPAIFERYRVDTLLTNGELLDVTPAYRALLEEAHGDGVQIHEVTIGERLDLGDGVIIEVLHPGEERNVENRNENSVSLRLTYGDFSLLLTGDAAEEAERAMVAGGLPLRALVFKAGHHGSNTSSNDFFLAAVQPQIVIISAGADNRFGHPHPAVLERVAAIGAQVLRTDELGTIEVITDGREMWWRAEN